MKQLRFSIRFKLTSGLLLPLIAAILVCSLAGVSIINSRVLGQAQTKAKTDLSTAREIYLNEIAHVRDVVRFSAATPSAAEAFESGSRPAIAALLAQLRKREQLDILTAVDHAGRVLFRARNPSAFGDRRMGDRLISRALKGEVISGTAVLPAASLAREGNDLAAQATIRVVPTPLAKVSGKKVEQAGMLLVASAPVTSGNGRIIGALYGGVLLNGNNHLVDKIKHIIFESMQENNEDVGAATIFLDDLRISTNALTADGTRAIGTQLSEVVYDRVMVKGEKWVGRAFVVKDWYFSAYEPIFDLNGSIVGSLYVGILERPYLRFKNKVILIFASVLLVGSVTGLAVSGYMGKRLAQPIRDLQNIVQRVSAGERNVPISVSADDEIGDLARDFHEMTNTLMRRESEIQELNRNLEQKVLDRTVELEEKNRLLMRTKEELVRAEKLAAIGELAAGVAHEINNPMAIIRGNAELLQMAMPLDNINREEVDTIVLQVGRVEKIVSNLLTFARREQKQLFKVQAAQLLDDIMKQVTHQASLTGIAVCRQYASQLPDMEADIDQLRQVFTNLILNAIQAMEEGGSLTLATHLGDSDGMCEISITDTGAGIDKSQIDQIFNPFFTTKRKGTGLGLSVSYGIVKDHGGRIEVASTPAGTEFKVIIPFAQKRSIPQR